MTASSEQPFFDAIAANDLAAVQQMLATAPELASVWRYDVIATPLHGCCYRPEIARILLEKSAPVDVIDSDERRKTPLHLAVQEGDLEFVAMLAAHGADVNAHSKWGTALHLALGGEDGQRPDNYLEIMQFLADHGADLSAPIDPQSDMWTPLHQACSEGLLPAVEFLVQRGAKLHAQKDGLTPLLTAQGMGFREIADFLVRRGAK